MDLRSLAASGRPAASVIKDPARLRRNVANMNAEDLRATQTDALDYVVRQSVKTNEDGVEFISGPKLKQTLNNLEESLNAVRLSDDDLARAHEIADVLTMAQRRSPAAVTKLYEDGPSSVLELVATWFGAQRGQAIASGGMGSSMVMAGWFAKSMRTVLNNMTTGKAMQLLRDATTDKELYAALMTDPRALPKKQEQAAKYLKSYLANITEENAREAGSVTPDEEYRNELRRLREEAQVMGAEY
jgi:hypothetical protein